MFLSPGKDSLIFAVTNLIVWGHQRKIRDLAPQRKKSILRVWLSQLFPTCPDLMSYHISSLIVRLYHFFSGYLQVYKYSCPVVPSSITLRLSLTIASFIQLLLTSPERIIIISPQRDYSFL